MTHSTDGDANPPAPPNPPQWGPPAQSAPQWTAPQPPAQPAAQWPAPQPPAQSAPQWAAPQSATQPPGPPYGQPGTESYGQYGQPQQQQYTSGTDTSWSAQPQGPSYGPPYDGSSGGAAPPKKSNKKLFVIIAAVVALALVGGGLFFFLSGDSITYQGRDILEPERVLSDAESRLDGIVEERNGAANEQTSCYFVARNAETTDIEDRLVCGPVLFVDGDAGMPYLTFPLEASAGEGDASLTVAAEPDSPDPAELANADLLRRPDGASPPEGNGGLAVPDPPRAEASVFTAVPGDGLDLESTPPTSRIGSPTMSIDVTGIGQPERYGQGDDARRPAEGERFVAFEIASGPGEIGPIAEFSIAVEVDDQDPAPLPDDADLSGGPVALAISVPEDADEVNLVVSEGTIVQRLSLTTGEPDPGNIALWQRANRSQSLGFAQPVTVRASAPGFVTEDIPSEVNVRQVDLTYFAGPNLDITPGAPSSALLVLDAFIGLDGSPGQFATVFWSLTLADGTVLPAGDLRPEPEQIGIVFEVPADFTEGTLTFGGVGPAPDGVTFDTLGAFIQIPVSIAAG